VQYLDGDPVRWFLRDEYGWVGLYNPSGAVVDAVYWDKYGNASNLFSASEYQQNIVTTTSCNGTQTLTAARNISGIEFVGASQASSYLSLQRQTDASLIGKNGPSTPTPHACNGPCAAPPQLSFIVQNENCNRGNGSISMTITDGHTGPYTTNWLNPSGVHSNTINNLSAGTYIVQVVDAYNCFIVYDTISIINIPGPSIAIDSIKNDMCSASDGSVYIHVIGGAQPFSYLWNSNPAQTTQNLTGVQAGNYSVTATDANGCKAYADTILADTSPPIIVVDQIISDTCNKHIGAIHITATGGNPPYSYEWSTDSSDITDHITGLSAGNYVVSVSDNFCTATASIQIDNIPGPQADFRFYPPVATIENPTFRFENWSTGVIDHWYWDFGDYGNSISKEPTHTYSAAGNYDVMLMISNNHGCVDSIVKKVMVIDKPSLYIPNCFTPNGDGINDYFYVIGTNITDLTLHLFNRWGELVFTSNSIDDKWNGKYKGDKVMPGVYNYVIFYKEDFGGVMLRPQTRTGQVTVLL
jgi:gliding motility-associated-like protein